MATAPDNVPVEQMETMLECSICTKTITQPRTLSCFHSFCEHCLQNFVATHRKKAVNAKAKVPEVFECPVCRTEFRVKEGESVEKMPSYHFINNMLELLTLQQQAQRIKCQSCKAEHPAASRCISCESYLCGKCLTAHNNFPAHSDHVVRLTLEKLTKPENRTKARGKPHCEKHDEVLAFYCKTCKILVCRYCMELNHPRPEHLFFPLADVVVQHKEALQASSAIFEQQMNKAVQSNLNIEHAMEALKNNTTKAKDAIIHQQHEILNALTKILQNETAVLLGAVDNKYNEANEHLRKQQADVKDYLEKAKSSLEFAKNIISNGSDEEILSLKHEVEEKSGSIEKERPGLMEPVHNGSIQYQAKASKYVLENVKLNELGKIVTTTPTFGSTTTAKTTTAIANLTFGTTTTKPVFGSTEIKPPLEAPKLYLNSTAESSEAFGESQKSISEVNKGANIVTGSRPNAALQPVQHASSASPFSFGAGFNRNSATTSAPFTFGNSTLGSTPPLFKATQSKADTPASDFTLPFGSSLFGNTSQSTEASGFGGRFSDLGCKPIEPNRNPFEVNPSPQSSDSSLFGNAAATSSPNQFQSPTFKPMFGSTAAAPSFGSPPLVGSNPTFGANPTFGGNPTIGAAPAFGVAPTFGAAPTFGSTPSFGGAPTFGSGVSGTTFGGSPSVGNTGSSRSRIFGSGTETAGMFGNSSSTPTFGSRSSQSSSMPSFGDLADGQNTASMNQAQGFGSSMIFGSRTVTAGLFGNSSSTPTFGSLSSQSSSMPLFGDLAGGQNTASMNQGQGFGSSMIFGSGTETAGMFGNSSSNPTFGSLSSQSTVPSFGGQAGGQNTAGMNQEQGFDSSMSGSSFSTYR